MAIASECAGWKYKHHGREPGAVDCYGLFLHVMREMGYRLPDAEYSTDDDEQYNLFLKNFHKHVEPIDPQGVRPGDVVLLNWGDQPCHLGVCLEFGKFIHAIRGGVVIMRLSRVPQLVHSFYRLKDSLRVDN